MAHDRGPWCRGVTAGPCRIFATGRKREDWDDPRVPPRTDDLFRIEGDPVLHRVPLDDPGLDTIPIPSVSCQFGPRGSCYAPAVDLRQDDGGNWTPLCRDHLNV